MNQGRTTHRVATALAAAATFSLALPGEALAGPKRLSLDDCVRLANQESQPLKRARAKIDEAEAKRRQIRGRFGPAVIVEAGIQRWDAPTEIEFALPTDSLPIEIPPISMEVQEQTTKQLSLTLAQPVTGLWAIYEGYRAMSLGEEAAEHERDATAHDVTKNVADAYFQALSAERMAEVAAQSEAQLEAHVTRAKALHKHGVLERSKVLEAQVRLAEVQAQAIEAKSLITLARSNLAFQIGLPASEPVRPIPVETTTAGPLRPYRDDAARAIEQRPDLAAVRFRVGQAEAGQQAARAQMLPELNLLASAQYARGSSFQQEEAYFIGAQLKWTLWEWGSTYYGIDEAAARLRQARSAEAELREGIRLQVRQARVELDTASRKIGVMRASVSQAEENLRLAKLRFEQEANTSTEVLDAESLLARARAGLVTARYQAERARVALRHTTGTLPVPVSAPGRTTR